MITFNGSQKEFFKAYPKEKRSLDEVYKLVNSAGETLYKFIGGLGEKCFKKADTKNEISKKDTNLTKDNKPTKIGYYTSWQTIYDKLTDIYDEFCAQEEDIVTDENRLSFEYLFTKARGFQDCPIGVEDFENFFSSIEKRIKKPSLKQEWLKLGKSFKHNIKAHNRKYANDYL